MNEKIKRLLEALTELYSWVDNWSPDFVDDDEWPDTKEKVEAALGENYDED